MEDLPSCPAMDFVFATDRIRAMRVEDSHAFWTV
jgi:hypothetical protein